MATIQDIEASCREKAAGIVRSSYETQDEIGHEIEPVEGPYVDLLTAKQRAKAARTKKAERARAKAEEYRKVHRNSSRSLLLSNQLMTPGGCIPIG
jgi:hypothetical protein